MTQSSTLNEFGATVVITHRICHDKHAEYENWLNENVPIGKAAPGYLDTHIVRPISGVSETFTIIVRFNNTDNLKQWMGSKERQRLIEKAQPLFVGADDFYISSGLDFWFTPAGAKAKIPVRWKQYLITWSAIYPLALLVPLVVLPIRKFLGIPSITPLNTLAVTAVIVFMMVYVVMPRYTRLVQRWLFS